MEALISDGWRVVAAEPIEEVTIEVVGRRFLLKKQEDGQG